MRCCSASAARVLTLIFLALLSTQSLLVNAQSVTDINAPTDIVDPDDTGPASSTTTTFSSSSTTSEHSSSSSHESSSQRPSVSTTTTSPVRESTTQPVPDPSPSSKSTPVSSSTTTSSSLPASSDSSSSSSSSISSSTTSTSSSSSTPAGVTLINNSGTTYQAPARTGNTVPDTTSYTWLTSSATATEGAAVGSAASSSSGFFDNKGAVAGTFTVIGVVAVGAILVGFFYAKRRAARLQDEEDMTYFEKYTGPNSDRAGSPTDMSFIGGHGGREDLNDAPITMHAATDAYPDRAMHFGLPAMDEYSNPQPMGLQFGNGVEYPPGTAYNPSQYGGYAGGYGTNQEYMSQEYNDARRSPSSPSHPYADPGNSRKAPGAPPVQHYYPPSDIVHGEAR